MFLETPSVSDPPFPQCDTGPAWCDPRTCQKQFSGPGSSCASSPPPANSSSSSSSSRPPASTTSSSYVSTVPNIDVCGHAVGGVSCPGAGVPPNSHVPGYYYRCCSSNGHCGPKNNIQSQDLYCGADTCQAGFGDCSTNRTAPPLSSHAPKTVGMGKTCGPIVNAKCGDGLCCSGSNFCGKSISFDAAGKTRTKGRGKKQIPHVSPPPSVHPRRVRLTKSSLKQAAQTTFAEQRTGASHTGATAMVTDNRPHPLNQSPTQPPQPAKRKSNQPKSQPILRPMSLSSRM